MQAPPPSLEDKHPSRLDDSRHVAAIRRTLCVRIPLTQHCQLAIAHRAHQRSCSLAYPVSAIAHRSRVNRSTTQQTICVPPAPFATAAKPCHLSPMPDLRRTYHASASTNNQHCSTTHRQYLYPMTQHTRCPVPCTRPGQSREQAKPLSPCCIVPSGLH